LTRIRNAAHARHTELELSYSRIREAIAKVLVIEGFLEAPRPVRGIQEDHQDSMRYSASPAVMQGIERIAAPAIPAVIEERGVRKISRGMEMKSSPLRSA